MLGDPEGRYRILRRIGEGAMGVVYLADDTRLGRQVALKAVLPGELSGAESTGELRQRLRREARIAAGISHPNVVTVFDLVQMGGHEVLVMEFVEGITLGDLIRKRGAMPPAQVVTILRQAALGLAAAHRGGLIHRDLKPANLMITASGVVKILDFGIAKRAREAVSGDEAIFGTPQYMSPEQIRGDLLDHRTDIFSLSAIGFELLTGRAAFRGSDVNAVMHAVQHDPAPFEELGAPEIPKALQEVIRQGLEKNRERRPASAEAIAATLGAGLGRQSASSTASGRLRSGKRRTPLGARPFRPWLAGVLTGVGLLLLVGAVLWRSPPTTPTVIRVPSNPTPVPPPPPPATIDPVLARADAFSAVAEAAEAQGRAAAARAAWDSAYRIAQRPTDSLQVARLDSLMAGVRRESLAVARRRAQTAAYVGGIRGLLIREWGRQPAGVTGGARCRARVTVTAEGVPQSPVVPECETNAAEIALGDLLNGLSYPVHSGRRVEVVIVTDGRDVRVSLVSGSP